VTKKPSLAETHPELAAQADGWDPTTVTKGSDKKVGWECELGHQWKATPGSRTRIKGTGCPFCAGKKVLAGFNDLATTNPELAAQADGWDPKTVTFGSHKKVDWRCAIGHTWSAPVKNRANGSGCPVCSGAAVWVGFNDLATVNPALAAQADGWDPTTSKAHSSKKVDWKCEFGHTWGAVIANRSQGRGCPVCVGKTVLKGFNDLATVNPALAAQADGWDPTTITAGSGIKVVWKCEVGHRWTASVVDRTGGHGCPVCSGAAVWVGFNDLATVNPALAAQADGWDPTTITVGSSIKVVWKCEVGHRWTASAKTRNSGIGCPICSNQAVLVGFNDLATTNPELASQADGWDPTTITAGSSIKVGWKCEVGHRWTGPVARRTRGHGCPSCATTGFDPYKPGFLYFMGHFDSHMFQIGITNFPDDRLGRHERSGWEVLELRGPMDGQLTQKLETDCLHALEKRGAILGHKAGIDKFDGYSEAWTKKSLNVTSIKQILDWVYEDDGA
jgi:hypothetical protein